MYLHISLPAHCNKNLHFRAALPLFTVHYAQHGVHRQNTKHLQHIIDFEALPVLIDLPQTENKMQRQVGHMQDSRKTQRKLRRLNCALRTAYTGKGSFSDCMLLLLAFFATQV